MFSPQVKQAVTTLAYTAYNHMPSLASPAQMASNLQKVALPVIALLGLHLVQGAEAGPVAYAQCVASTGPWGALLCLPLLLTPGP